MFRSRRHLLSALAILITMGTAHPALAEDIVPPTGGTPVLFVYDEDNADPATDLVFVGEPEVDALLLAPRCVSGRSHPYSATRTADDATGQEAFSLTVSVTFSYDCKKVYSISPSASHSESAYYTFIGYDDNAVRGSGSSKATYTVIGRWGICVVTTANCAVEKTLGFSWTMSSNGKASGTKIN
jgi:hypothetical protein